MPRPPADPALHDVGALADLVEGVPAAVSVDGREIALVRWGGEVFALRDVCPHQSRALSGGRVRDGIVRGDRIGDVELAGDRPVIACPWHAFEFDLRSGRCAVDPKMRVRTYRVEVRDGRILIESGRPRRTGRATGEVGELHLQGPSRTV